MAEIALSSATYETFGFVFDEAGTYAFTSSCDPDSNLVLAVMPAGVRCELAGAMSEPMVFGARGPIDCERVARSRSRALARSAGSARAAVCCLARASMTEQRGCGRRPSAFARSPRLLCFVPQQKSICMIGAHRSSCWAGVRRWGHCASLSTHADDPLRGRPRGLRRGLSCLGYPHSCTTEAQFVPLTASNLILLGVTRNSDGITLAPDWMLIGGLFAGIAFMVLG